MLDPNRYRPSFPVCRDRVYLNHAGVSPVSLPVREAVVRWLDDAVFRGVEGAGAWERTAARGRELAAQLVGAAPEELAYVRSTSHGLGLVAEGLDWRPGDEVAVCTAVEYPSNVYPWLHLASRGVRIRDIEPVAGAVTVDAVARALTQRTRLVAVSSVQYATGCATDLAAVGALCRQRGALLAVDAIQSLGVAPMRAKEWGVHFASADSHKWMLGLLGIGVLYVDAGILPSLRPAIVGWKSTVDGWNFDRVHFELRQDAGRFEEGSLPYGLIHGLVAALEMLHEAGIDAIFAYVSRLLQRLESGLVELGAQVGPGAAMRAGAITATFAGHESDVLAAQLASQGIVASARRGYLRFAPHLYNTEEDIERAIAALRSLVKGTPGP